MGLFGQTKVDPKVQVDEWTKTCRQSCRDMDRQVRNVQREEEKAKRSLRDAAKKGDKDVCKILATEIVRSRRTVNKINLAKVQVNSLILNMRHQLATLRVAGSLQKSTEVMSAIQSLIKLPEINQIMQNMAKEMMRAGIIEEMMEDAMESVIDEDGIEEEADSEVEKVLWELTQGKLGEAPRAIADSLPSTSVAKRVPAGAKAALTPALTDPDADGDDEEDMETMRKRLDHLKS
ncbi:Charged multivesicular body protein 3 [Hypsibius exemplaris]|uniref:Charged multivesicular body protein 3 n=1 Tax=Hypsibius exemplaris TaxID=2072580 RepID=A0A1W0XEX8_HYPEX|nr:Charged multivesicular body protein 3 [Hypsibius exemplaris]